MFHCYNKADGSLPCDSREIVHNLVVFNELCPSFSKSHTNIFFNVMIKFCPDLETKLKLKLEYQFSEN